VVARDVFDWDLGWRFAFQAPTPQQACNASSFPVDASGTQCFGLTPIFGVSTPEGCVQAACDAGGVMWQLGSKVAPPAASCWVGTPAPQPCAPAAGAWVGGASAAPPPAFPFDVAPAAPAFNDSLWAVMDAPHDALIAQNYSEAQNNGQGNLPKQRLWYRKRFTLPAEWSGSHVSIYFEGVFSVATVFLNGLPLQTHASGYTSFAAVLHNAFLSALGGRQRACCARGRLCDLRLVVRRRRHFSQRAYHAQLAASRRRRRAIQPHRQRRVLALGRFAL
jgi:hypothetical protein